MLVLQSLSATAKGLVARQHVVQALTVETPKKIPNIVVSKFLQKSGTDALRKHICTQCVLKRNTSEGEMPRAHTGAAFFHCGSGVRLQVCRRGFPLLAPVAGGFTR